MTNTITLKTLRGDILSFIYNVSPQMVKESNIISAYFEYYQVKDIRRAIIYLIDKGYIKKSEMANPIKPSTSDVFYLITSDGMNIYERTQKDPGIYIEEEKE